MIRKKPSNKSCDHHSCPLLEMEDSIWDGIERRQHHYQPAAPAPVTPVPEQNTFGKMMPFIGQVIALIIGGITIYINIHEDLLTQTIKLNSFIEKYEDDNDRHNKTHADIYEKVNGVSKQTESLEETVSQVLSRHSK